MNVLVTGAASGIGKATVECFLKRGHVVYAVDINECEKKDNLFSYVADITNEDSLTAVKEAVASLGAKLDAIICIAGIHTMAALVESDYARIKRVIDVNLLSTMLTCRTLHSLLSDSGRVVIVTSEVATYAPMPFNGLYNVSKTALDSYADALRQELNLLGQRVVVVRPGAIETPLAASSATSTERLAADTVLYKKQAKHFSSLVRRFTGTPMCPCALAPLIYKAVSKKRPRLAYSKNRNPGLVLLSILPKRAQCSIIKFLLSRK